MNIALREPMSRRHLLRGAGAALALPLLNAMAPRSVFGATLKPPTRMAFLYFPNGVHMPMWAKKGHAGADYPLPPLLEPLKAHREDFSLLSGLASLEGRGYDDGGNHAPAMGSFLTGVHPRKSVTCGVSVDQVAARELGHLTRLPSLEIATPRQGKESCDKYPCVVTSTLSWRTPTQPLPVETSPKAIFDRLFGTGAGKARDIDTRRSILDAVRGQARQLSRSVDAEDRYKIDEYLTSVREIEQRIERSESMPPPMPPAGLAVPPEEPPAQFAENVQLLGDLMVAAFRTDATRICSFVFESEGSNRSYPEIGIDREHHHLSHHGGKEDMIDDLVRIERHHMAQFAYLLGRMKETREQDGSLLDHSMVAFGCALGDGGRHDHFDLPILVAGRGNGTLRPGRHIVYPKDTPLSNLWMAMLERVDVKPERLGDSTGVLKSLS